MAASTPPVDETTADETGLDLPGHVAFVTDADAEPAPVQDRDGDYDQLDAQGTRYYEAEANDERKRKGICPVCGEAGHEKKKCPYKQCLACGAIDEHAMRDCPLGTSCFRCGAVGHRSKDCPMPRVGPSRARYCERCGQPGHPETTCHTLWRIYTYRTQSDYDQARAKLWRHEQRREARKNALEQRRKKRKSGWAVALVESSEEVGPSDSSDSDASDDSDSEATPPRDWDSAVRYCYNCAAKSHHWGDDCFLRRTNPTRPTGDPSPFSEIGANTGPFAPRSKTLSVRGAASQTVPRSKRRSSDVAPSRPSLLEDMQGGDEQDWFVRREKLRHNETFLSDADSPRGRHRSRPSLKRSASSRDASRSRQDRAFRPQYRGGYS
ncbi:TRAMP complex protein [Malassezia pachydermatis]